LTRRDPTQIGGYRLPWWRALDLPVLTDHALAGSLLVSDTCDHCAAAEANPERTTVTGRHLCDSCADELLGATAGVIAGGGVAGAISTAGWFSRLRARRREKDR
jgi:hypothetical protein